jgi:hypothetical protein
VAVPVGQQNHRGHILAHDDDIARSAHETRGRRRIGPKAAFSRHRDDVIDRDTRRLQERDPRCGAGFQLLDLDLRFAAEL